MSSPIFYFTISPGATNSFDMTIIDDITRNSEELIAFNIGVYVSEGRDHCGHFHVFITDDSGIVLSK